MNLAAKVLKAELDPA